MILKSKINLLEHILRGNNLITTIIQETIQRRKEEGEKNKNKNTYQSIDNQAWDKTTRR